MIKESPLQFLLILKLLHETTEALLGGGGGAHVPRLIFTASYVAISEHSRVACRNFNNNFLARCQSDNPHSLQRRQRNIRPPSLVLLSPGF